MIIPVYNWPSAGINGDLLTFKNVLPIIVNIDRTKIGISNKIYLLLFVSCW